MKEAGYADGFTMTLDATNNRYVNDQQVAQALAPVEAQPRGSDLEPGLLLEQVELGALRF